ncbi:MAG: HAD family hydrolase [Eubacteriales bacterium]|nr:HAD family hydrolase [Eubacteriales bacterium]MDD4541576.1 HAD family hydrolase [Eubacteriales bacterium]
MELNKVKMIVTDLDETLLRTDKTISQYTIDTIKKVRQKGIKFIFATARGSSAYRFVDAELFDAYVLLNGTKAYIGDNLIYEKTIPPDVFVPILQNLSASKLKCAAEVGGLHYANFNIKEKWADMEDFIYSDFSDISAPADKLYILIEDPGQLDLVAALLPAGLYLNPSRDNMAMVMHQEATKLKGVRAIAEEFGISRQQIIAFGDDINDKEMLLHCGFGVAMENALDEVLAVADHICELSNQDGVAKWLEEHILLQR